MNMHGSIQHGNGSKIRDEILSRGYLQQGGHQLRPIGEQLDHSLHLIKSHLEAGDVKIYGTDSDIGLTVAVKLPNNIINRVSSNQSLADALAESNLVPLYPSTKIISAQFLMSGIPIPQQPGTSLSGMESYFCLTSCCGTTWSLHCGRSAMPSSGTSSTGLRLAPQWLWSY